MLKHWSVKTFITFITFITLFGFLGFQFGAVFNDSRDITQEDLTEFLADDDTNLNLYRRGIFECQDFAFQLNMRAEALGWRCALVLFHVTYSSAGEAQWHYINAFKADKRLIFIEPRTDKEVDLQMGEYYFWENEGWEGYGYVDKIYIGW